MINHDGKEYEKEYICMYTESLCCIAEINTFFFVFSKAAPEAYGGSQARGLIG